MSRKKSRTTLRRRPSQADYEVGYGKPPTRGRFKPGVSGNPRGRPKGTRNKLPRLAEQRLQDIIIAEAYRMIDVREGERTVSYPIAQAVVRSLAVNAAKGQARSQELFTELLTATERSRNRACQELFESAVIYKAEWERELEDRQRTGRTGPEPLPHPDDVVLDMNTGLVSFKGPTTKEQKAKFDMMRERKREFEAELADLRQTLTDNPNHEHRKFIEADIRHDEKILAIIRRVIPD